MAQLDFAVESAQIRCLSCSTTAAAGRSKEGESGSPATPLIKWSLSRGGSQEQGSPPSASPASQKSTTNSPPHARCSVQCSVIVQQALARHQPRGNQHEQPMSSPDMHCPVLQAHTGCCGCPFNLTPAPAAGACTSHSA